MTRRHFGSQPGELASVDIVLAMRRRERDAEEAAARAEQKFDRAQPRILRRLAQRLFGDAGSRAPNEAADGPR